MSPAPTIRTVTRTLTERERRTVVLWNANELTSHQIGAIIGVTGPAITQMVTRIRAIGYDVTDRGRGWRPASVIQARVDARSAGCEVVVSNHAPETLSPADRKALIETARRETGWTDTRVEATKYLLFREGLSRAEAARIIGGVTRHGVIGLSWRKGWSESGGPKGYAAKRAPARSYAPPRPRPTPKPTAPPKLSVVTAAPFVEPVESLTATRDLLTLGAHMCRWPIGDPQAPGFGFCARSTTDEAVYCPAHRRVAYVPPVKHRTANDLARSLRKYA